MDCGVNSLRSVNALCANMNSTRFRTGRTGWKRSGTDTLEELVKGYNDTLSTLLVKLDHQLVLVILPLGNDLLGLTTQQDALVREPCLLLVHKMIERRENVHYVIMQYSPLCTLIMNKWKKKILPASKDWKDSNVPKGCT